eukprot:CAMPEP_0117038588 /NCGR_PEP_ID=MMETSP0472-20121206/27141_1 /TAXON_ID=693140 ORGANISM="Tiarina fusus, Strain LIS" /NCGR_SAMPLE_ID=MMETSP0472 /ASSEMBLY_ACC=CAM_ASM_000603 /LENGTH=1208 /DNA_ID=CAMNT_0004748853 /DNA_START=141 /DNA_END=3768 /DNA_ORIENTATION=+
MSKITFDFGTSFSQREAEETAKRRGGKEKRLDDDDDDDNDGLSDEGSLSSQSPNSSGDHSSSLSGSGSVSGGSSYSSSVGGHSSSTRGVARALKRTFSEATFKVRVLWFSVVAIMTMAGIFVAQATHSFSSKSQEVNFEQQFNYYANTLADRSYTRFDAVEIKMSTQATANTLNAVEKGEEWPFVVCNTFEQRGQNMLRLSGAESYVTVIFVKEDERDQWETFSQVNQGWVQAGLDRRGETDERALPITGYVHTSDNAERDPGPGPYAPIWQIAPAPVDPLEVNFNLYSDEIFKQSLEFLIREQVPVVTQVLNYLVQHETDDHEEPRSCYMFPIRRTPDAGADIVGSGLNCFKWDAMFKDILHEDAPNGIVLVLSNECGQAYTYTVNHEEVFYIGEGDRHDPAFNEFVVSQSMHIDHGENLEGLCPFQIDIYPSEEFRSVFETNEPFIYTVGVAAVFSLSVFCFLLYGTCVERRQKDNLESTLRVNAIVGSLFPKQVLNRLLAEQGRINKAGGADDSHRDMQAVPTGLVSAAIQVHGREESSIMGTPNIPIADLFPSHVQRFGRFYRLEFGEGADAGVSLLETVYYNFDMIAHKRRVFKVETIGDCYVAVCGLPEPRKHHATVMAKFANDCMEKLNEVVRSLEIELGPDTAELSMRFGLHSGPVTAGVLRGEKSRFQLFGETVDLAAEMEHSGMRNRIHVSQATADLIILSGKDKWIKAREDKVYDEKKGDLQTYWVNIHVDTDGSVQSRLSSYMSSGHSSSGESMGDSLGDDFDMAQFGQMIQIQGLNQMNDKTVRLVDWMTELMSRSLKKIVAMRADEGEEVSSMFSALHMDEGTVLDEVKEIIKLPGKAKMYKNDPESVVLDEKVQKQLKDYVQRIASMYREVPFHGFEHASHVTMSVGKLLSRIVDTQGIDFKAMSYKNDDFQVLHETTYGITSDPLTQFALAFSALIHDVDHTGVPNATLVQEKASLAELYNNKSVAEQNSVDLAWDMFLEPQYGDLQRCICPSQEDYQRFRQLVVNTVMATDIVDKELGALRKERWLHAFDDEITDEDPLDTVNRKATIVIEHLMQASDVAHTMQHWHVYQKWNERFFQECYMAFKEGRAEKDPSIGWYKGEIGFFDFYVIPLAKKLKDCGVFGVSSDEYLTYAQKNRDEWERKGEYLVAEYLTRYEEKYGVGYDCQLLDEYQVEMNGDDEYSVEMKGDEKM